MPLVVPQSCTTIIKIHRNLPPVNSLDTLFSLGITLHLPLVEIEIGRGKWQEAEYQWRFTVEVASGPEILISSPGSTHKTSTIHCPTSMLMQISSTSYHICWKSHPFRKNLKLYSCSPCCGSRKLWTVYETVSCMQRLHARYALRTCYYGRASLWRQHQALNYAQLQATVSFTVMYMFLFLTDLAKWTGVL